MSSLVIRKDGTAGHMFAYHPKLFEKMHEEFDMEPKKWCCNYTDNCHIYIDARPIDNCNNYVAPSIGEYFCYNADEESCI